LKLFIINFQEAQTRRRHLLSLISSACVSRNPLKEQISFGWETKAQVADAIIGPDKLLQFYLHLCAKFFGEPEWESEPRPSLNIQMRSFLAFLRSLLLQVMLLLNV
jgi:hypothetical protein